VEGSCEHGNEPSDSIKCWEVLDSFSRRTQLHEVSYFVLMFPSFNVFCYEISTSGRDHFYMLLYYIILSQYIGS
jgi:hypothetical protein